MLTLRTILKELKNVPVNRLEDLYSIIRSFTTATTKSKSSKEKILSYAGSFSDMSPDEFNDFEKELKNTRNQLFDRNIDL